MYEASLRCSTTLHTYIPKLSEGEKNNLLQEHTRIVDSGATQVYIAPNAPHGTLDTSATKIRVGTENGRVATSEAKATLSISQLTADLPTAVYIIPTFTNTLIVVDPIFDANYTRLFKNQDVTVLSPVGNPILQG